MGRRVPQEPQAYTLDNFRAWTDRSRANLGVDTLDLVQLHCPPTAGLLRPTRSSTRWTPSSQEGRIAAYGVSVETCDEALAAIARPGVASVQIILNAFRLKPLERVLPAAAAGRASGIIARVPLASGLLSGRYDEHTTFPADDHRTYNRHGEAFDVGETFSGVRLRGRAGGCAAAGAAGPDGRHHGAVRAALDHRPAGRERRHPRRPQRRPRRRPTPRAADAGAAATRPRWPSVERDL